LPQHVKLIAVSKTKAEDVILEAYNQGQRVFGENKVQELTRKYENLPKDIEWHMIGHLQTNKVKFIAPFVSMIHSVDSHKLLKMINKEANKHNRSINVLLQVHIAEEESKFGIPPAKINEFLEESNINELENVNICGVMGMATFTEDKEVVASEFEQLNQVFKQLKNGFFKNDDGFQEISMGMSNDYSLAINKGSTLVRIGSSIFGERNYK
jgi:hypothetical protein